ncbi:MAG: hypothetical protein HF312_15390 [Ignavibacteria bacterium]|jgi:hypothetical protein|nr:hypothetical protein [Ignavibacteria bacterium]
MARTTVPVEKILEVHPTWVAEATPGVPVAGGVSTDRMSRGRVYMHANVQTQRHVGGITDRRGGIIRAGIDSLELEMQGIDFIVNALRKTGSAWAPDGKCPSMTMTAGSSKEGLKLWGCVIDSLDLEQEYTEDSEVLKGTFSILALGGQIVNNLTNTALNDPVLRGWQSVAALTGPTVPTGGFRIRSWKIGLKNNHKYMTYGDKIANTTPRTGSSIREAYELKPGEEEVTFEGTCEVPMDWAAANSSDFAAACFQPGSVGATITYTNCGDTGNPFIATLSNMSVDNDFGFEYECDATNGASEPVHVFSFKTSKTNPYLQSLAFSEQTGV